MSDDAPAAGSVDILVTDQGEMLQLDVVGPPAPFDFSQPIPEPTECPKCGEDGIWRDEADVGVGTIYGPWGCPVCGWSESAKYDLSGDKSPIDEKGGATDQFGIYHPPGSTTARAYRMAEILNQRPSMKTFLIAPVRGHSSDAHAAVVKKLETEGWQVYWPARDTDQSDVIGFQICSQNAAAIQEADAVHVIWDGASQGCLFDLGMAFALGKRVIPIALPDPTLGKSFQNMVRVWAAT